MTETLEKRWRCGVDVGEAGRCAVGGTKGREGEREDVQEGVRGV